MSLQTVQWKWFGLHSRGETRLSSFVKCRYVGSNVKVYTYLTWRCMSLEGVDKLHMYVYVCIHTYVCMYLHTCVCMCVIELLCGYCWDTHVSPSRWRPFLISNFCQWIVVLSFNAYIFHALYGQMFVHIYSSQRVYILTAVLYPGIGLLSCNLHLMVL